MMLIFEAGSALVLTGVAPEIFGGFLASIIYSPDLFTGTMDATSSRISFASCSI